MGPLASVPPDLGAPLSCAPSLSEILVTCLTLFDVTLTFSKKKASTYMLPSSSLQNLFGKVRARSCFWSRLLADEAKCGLKGFDILPDLELACYLLDFFFKFP